MSDWSDRSDRSDGARNASRRSEAAGDRKVESEFGSGFIDVEAAEKGITEPDRGQVEIGFGVGDLIEHICQDQDVLRILRTAEIVF